MRAAVSSGRSDNGQLLADEARRFAGRTGLQRS